MGNDMGVPYSGYIPRGVHDGTDVDLRIRTHHNFNSFSINLCTGRNIHESDTAFHFNPRFNDRKVVMNHKQGNSWGQEDNENSMPFQRGYSYSIHIIVKEGRFKVKVNNSLFAKFKHRLPLDTIHYLYIEGDIGIEAIRFSEKHGGHHGGHGHHGGGSVAPSYPQPSMGFPQIPAPAPAPIYPPQPGFTPAPYAPAPAPYPAPGQAPYPGAGGNAIYNPRIPVTTVIPTGMRPGSIIYISGVPFPNCARFTINLATAGYETADFALHMDSRFNFGNDHGVVIRTHKQGGQYGNEEKHQSFFPFTPGSNFDIMILTEPGSYKIAVNNQHFTEFSHRIPYDRVNHLLISGDVTIREIRFQ